MSFKGCAPLSVVAFFSIPSRAGSGIFSLSLIGLCTWYKSKLRQRLDDSSEVIQWLVAGWKCLFWTFALPLTSWTMSPYVMMCGQRSIRQTVHQRLSRHWSSMMVHWCSAWRVTSTKYEQKRA